MTVRVSTEAVYRAVCDLCKIVAPPTQGRPRPGGWGTLDAHLRVSPPDNVPEWAHLDLCPRCRARTVEFLGLGGPAPKSGA